MNLLSRVFPAPAGINRGGGQWRANNRSVPRASGDKPLFYLHLLATGKCSPRQRG
ncbi:TPA: hypothetical protein H1V01_001262 [Salmonella enterica]|nr:hypothetical protein [Salmonella enterica]